MECDKVGDDNTNAKDNTSDISIISANFVQPSKIEENGEKNENDNKEIDGVGESMKCTKEMEKTFEKKNELDDEKSSTKFNELKSLKAIKEDNGNVKNGEKNYNDNKEIDGEGESMKCTKEMEKTFEKKNELDDEKSSTKFNELKSLIANENNLAKFSVTNDVIMAEEPLIVDSITKKITIEEAILEKTQNLPINPTNEKNEKFHKINDTVNLKNSGNSIDDNKNMKKPEVEKVITSLAFIASAYDNSDSESDQPQSVYEEKNNSNEMEIQITKDYRNKSTVATSDEETSSDDDSSDKIDNSSNEAESDDSAKKSKKFKKNKNERNRSKSSQEKELKGEFDDLPPIEELKISVPEVLCDPLGEVGWMVEQMVVVRPKPGKPTLNIDTILFVERGRRVLGRIFDVFGQVSEPHYCVRFNNAIHIKESDIKVGMIVYFCPNTEYTSVVFLQDLLKMKAVDELGDDEHPEFSDDEEERAYYAAFKQKQKQDKTKSVCEVPQKRQRTDGQDPGWKSNHPWSTARKQQQQQKSQKPGKIYPKTPDWSTQQPAGCHSSKFWQHPSSYQNNSWPVQEQQTYQSNVWPQNPYNYNEQFVNRHQQGSSRQSFRPPHTFQPGATNPYMNNSLYPPQSNPTRYPAMNFSWQSQGPRQSDIAWPLSPPPPPPPGI